MPLPLRTSTPPRVYHRVAFENQGDDSANATESNSSDVSLSLQDNENVSTKDDENPLVSPSVAPPLAPQPPIHREINVILMDAAQYKFNIRACSMWKVSDFKEVSALVTKVPAHSQRLIYMGKLLKDSSTLSDFGINEEGKIVHLFPKPNVVINNSSSHYENGQANNTETNANDEVEEAISGGAHIPQIHLDAEEASRRSHILILSSQEIFEAQHRVKIFSFLLMIISSMELLTVMTLFVGVQAEDPYGGGGASSNPPGNPTDTPPSPSSSSTIRTWQNSDYFDALISAFGFYVSLLGIKATTENTLPLAKRYFLCLLLAGVGYNLYYYYTNLHQEEKRAHESNLEINSSELRRTAFMGILVPMTVWLLCIVRAYQFQALIHAAEVEAEERTRGQNGENPSNNADEVPYGNDDNELPSS